ncbi:MAG: 4,5-DOPA dioxygenase extradiol [Endomicrobiales bacterium]|jgi:4,5-DOPA dioxygenase extradiol
MHNLMPVVFIGHGSPMNAIQNNAFTQSLSTYAGRIAKPKVILCISAHWMTNGTYITGSDNPEQIYDFYGFPQELYEVRYRPEGSKILAQQFIKILGDSTKGLDRSWGIDHGTWAVLKHMYPACDIPVIELSLDAAKSESEHYTMSKKLSGLRKEGVLIIGSGNIVHNLSRIDWAQFAEKTPQWAQEFDSYVKDALESGNDGALIDYAGKTSSAAYAVPTNEHYLPLLYTCALRGAGEKAHYFYEGFQHASISMRSFAFGSS